MSVFQWTRNLTLMLGAVLLAQAAQAERLYFTDYGYPAKTEQARFFYVDTPLPENPDGPGYLYKAYYQSNDALYAEGARAGTDKDADWYGDWRYLYPDGTLKEKGHSDEQGRLDGEIISYHENGQVDTLRRYRHGKPHGVEKHYDEDGNLLARTPYKDGAVTGMRVAYYSKVNGQGGGKDGGQIHEERRYKGGRYDFLFNRYDRDGNPLAHEAYVAPGILMGWHKNSDGVYLSREATYQRDAQGRFHNEAPVWLRLKAEHNPDGTPRFIYLRYPQKDSVWKIGLVNDRVVKLQHLVGGIAQGKAIIGQYSGAREEGRMKDGRRTGEWREYDDDGTLIAVKRFQNGQRQGESRKRGGPEHQLWTYHDYQQGKKDGPWRTENADGEVLESGRYRNDRPVGDWRTLDTNGNIEQAHYVNGKLHGDWTRATPDGTLLDQRHYRNGKAVGDWESHDEDGNLVFRAHFVNGEKEGEAFKVLYEGRQRHAHFKAGKRDGEYLETSPEGYPRLVGQYRDDKRQGRFIEYDEEGQVERITPYRDGVENGEGWISDRDGKMIPARWRDGDRLEP